MRVAGLVVSLITGGGAIIRGLTDVILQRQPNTATSKLSHGFVADAKAMGLEGAAAADWVKDMLKLHFERNPQLVASPPPRLPTSDAPAALPASGSAS